MQAFKVHPKGTRKIVISTNIAETSVTIEDIVFVVDTGRLKERRYDPSRSMSMLVEDTISVANATQRKGRAGRVREGVCYSLYTRHCFEKRMKKYQVLRHLYSLQFFILAWLVKHPNNLALSLVFYFIADP